ncbi:hypothetical protein MRX96_039435 [Rhipicephalus microplus]
MNEYFFKLQEDDDGVSDESLQRLVLVFAVTACLLGVVLTLSLTRRRETPVQDDDDSARASQTTVAPDPKEVEARARRRRKFEILRRRAAKQELTNPSREEWIYVDAQGRPVAYLTSKQTVTVTYNGTTKTTVTNTTTTVTTSNDAYATRSRRRGSQATAAASSRPHKHNGVALGSSGRDGVLVSDGNDPKTSSRAKKTSGR